jgi:hypothetical protein
MKQVEVPTLVNRRISPSWPPAAPPLTAVIRRTLAEHSAIALSPACVVAAGGVGGGGLVETDGEVAVGVSCVEALAFVPTVGPGVHPAASTAVMITGPTNHLACR